MIFYNNQIPKALIKMRECWGWGVPLLFATVLVEAHNMLTGFANKEL